jgi:hypothetical protein
MAQMRLHRFSYGDKRRNKLNTEMNKMSIRRFLVSFVSVVILLTLAVANTLGQKPARRPDLGAKIVVDQPGSVSAAKLRRSRIGIKLPPAPSEASTGNNLEDILIYRAQLRVRTADRKDANTDDAVQVRLNGRNATWMDQPGDDRERGDLFTYDLMLTDPSGISTLSRVRDITMLEVTKTGSDGWCFTTLDLMINGKSIYSQSFGEGKWLDNDKGRRAVYQGSRTALRRNGSWKNYTTPKPNPVITRSELESRIAAIVGHHLHFDEGIKWGKLHGRGVEVSQKDTQTVHIDLDLQSVVNNLPDPEVDVDFDVHIYAADGELNLELQNFKVDVDSTFYDVLLGVNGFFGGTSMRGLNRSITRQVKQQLGGRVGGVSTGNVELEVYVNPQGDVVLIPKS